MELKKWITNGTFCDYFVTFVRTVEKETIVNHMLLLKSTEGIIINIYIIIYIYYHKYLYINMLSYIFVYIYMYI